MDKGKLPAPPMLMMDRITHISDEGGKYGKGEIKAELDIDQSQWFLDCHFKGDAERPRAAPEGRRYPRSESVPSRTANDQRIPRARYCVKTSDIIDLCTYICCTTDRMGRGTYKTSNARLDYHDRVPATVPKTSGFTAQGAASYLLQRHAACRWRSRTPRAHNCGARTRSCPHPR